MHRPILLVLASSLAAACFGNGTTYGNIIETCSAGEPCVCDVTGNCSFSCPGGGCEFTCENTGNCIMDCADNCTATCSGTGNCSLTCDGSNCQITSCAIQGNCVCTDSDGCN